MANKRNFKKYVDALGAAVVDEIVTSYYNVPGADKEKLSEALGVVLGAVGKAKNNSNIYFDRGRRSYENKKEYSVARKNFFVSLFDKIDTEFDEEIEAALKLLNAALPADEKARNKEMAAAAN